VGGIAKKHMTVTPQTSPSLNRVRELPAGDKVTGFYLLTKLETRQKKDGVPYLVCTLQDSTASLEAIFWENFSDFLNTAEIGSVLKVEGTLDRYRDVPRLHLIRVRKATEDEVPDRRAFLPHSPLTAEDARRQISEIIAAFENMPLQALLESVFNDEEFARGFFEAPGGKMWHHAALGGLAEHTLSLAKVADAVCTLYPVLHRDLLVAGALLHDIGKVFEFTTDVAIDYSVEGRLLGHIVQGTLLLERKIAELPEFPEETRRQILHLVLSHQGDGSMGSPVKPMTREALTLHYLDELDSRLEAFARIQSNTPPGQDFSDYVRLMERFFYLRSLDDNTGSPS
jgi:3'-5' exoribonuclease